MGGDLFNEPSSDEGRGAGVIRKPQSPAERIGLVLLFQLLLYMLKALLLAAVQCPPTVRQVISMLASAAVFICPTVLYMRLSGTRVGKILHPFAAEAKGRSRVSPIQAIVAALIVINAVALAGMLTQALFFAGGARSETALSTEPIAVVLGFISSVVLTPVLEELLFRGAVLDAYEPHGARTAILASAATFALMHYSLYSLIYAFCAGALIAYLAVRARSLAFAIWLHAANNATTFAFSLLLSVRPELYDRASTVFLAVTLPVSVFGAVMLVREELKKPARAYRSQSRQTLPHPISPELAAYALLAVIASVL